MQHGKSAEFLSPEYKPKNVKVGRCSRWPAEFLLLTKSVKFTAAPCVQKRLSSTTLRVGAHGTNVTLISEKTHDHGGLRK